MGWGEETTDRTGPVTWKLVGSPANHADRAGHDARLLIEAQWAGQLRQRDLKRHDDSFSRISGITGVPGLLVRS